jgi:hypothetical protein
MTDQLFGSGLTIEVSRMRRQVALVLNCKDAYEAMQLYDRLVASTAKGYIVIATDGLTSGPIAD